MSLSLFATVSITCASGSVETTFPRSEVEHLARNAVLLQRRFPSEFATRDLVSMQTVSYLADLKSLPGDKAHASNAIVKNGIIIMALTIFLGRDDYFDEVLKALHSGCDLAIVFYEDTASMIIKGPGFRKVISLELSHETTKRTLQ
jgi:hypothetical protein